MAILEDIAGKIQQGDAVAAEDLVKEALAQKISAEKILNEGLVEGMNIVSEKFKSYEYFIPEVLISAKAMNRGLDILKPYLAEMNVQPLGKVVMGTIQGDVHDIGKNIVGMLLQGAGFEIVDLGANVPVEKFIEAAISEKADMVGISALLTSTMVNMKLVIDGLMDAGLKGKVKVIIGGAPVTPEYAAEIGADAYGPDAASAVDITKTVLNL